MNIDETLDGLQKAVEEMKEERGRIADLEEQVTALIRETERWFEDHGHELPEKGE